MSAISINKLTKKYGKKVAVDNIDLNIKSGDFFGFIGPNGAGKTTTIKTMLNLLNPYIGEIRLLGKDIKQNQFQAHVGYVPGEANLYENLKVKDQINYFGRFFDNLDEEYLNTLKEMFLIDEHQRISELSLGNKKKVSIVCALMNKPKLLVFDEVTNSLDPIMQRTLFNELLRLNKEGTTIFFSSHNLEEVQTYCKNIAIIREGKIIKHDNVQKILDANGVQVTIKTKQKLNPGFLKKHDVKHTEMGTGAITFRYKGDLDELIYYLSKYKLDSVRIADVKLEDIFDHYYEGDNK
jgi:ABC-2 type transport system ATP-binding protein